MSGPFLPKPNTLLSFPKTVLLATLALAPLSSAQQRIPFESLAKKAVQRLAAADSSPETLDLEEIFLGSSVHVRLGLFEVFLSTDRTRDGVSAEHMARVCKSLLDLQGAWLAWIEPLAEHDQPAKDLKVLRKWASSLRGGSLQALAQEGGGEVFAGLRAKDSVREAAERFATFMGTGGSLGLQREDQPEALVLAADRTEFLELLAFSGWLYSDLQEVYWQDHVAGWTNCYVDRYKFLSLQYASPFSGAHWSAGTDMNANVEDGLAQQVTQLAANSLIDSYYGERVPPALAGALSVNLTIDVFGSCDTRVDGDLRSRRTEAIEVFVPGGASEGGFLGKQEAGSRWRVQKGMDRFIKVLKASQRNGGAENARAAGKLQHFEIENDRKNKRIAVSGPFLGAAAATAEAPGEAFFGDYLEFLRAYRSCFIYWLRDASQRKEKTSRLAFARWLVHLATESELTLEQSMLEAFGTALSDETLEDDVLEGAFLAWLQKKARG